MIHAALALHVIHMPHHSQLTLSRETKSSDAASSSTRAACTLFIFLLQRCRVVCNWAAHVAALSSSVQTTPMIVASEIPFPLLSCPLAASPC